jgi:BirA family transcriptional regulator, biotin operon repressor / biotin---[acetyl-CoA-carboxylase] ligase
MQRLVTALIHLLADGKFHAKDELTRHFCISSKHLHTMLKAMHALGIALTENAQGCRLPGGLELLDKTQILNQLGENKKLLRRLKILTSIDSTNTYLLTNAASFNNYALFAELQTAGRGQFNRSWISTGFAKNIALSLRWYFPKHKNLSGLSLIMGLAIVNALAEYGLDSIQLKWPNDIMYQGKKLGGILIETLTKTAWDVVVIGLGLNLYTPSLKSDSIAQAFTDIYSIQKSAPQRNKLAALVLKHILTSLKKFHTTDFSRFACEWKKFDYLLDRSIILKQQQETYTGIAQGVNAKGQLCVIINGKLQAFNNGEVHIKK